MPKTKELALTEEQKLLLKKKRWDEKKPFHIAVFKDETPKGVWDLYCTLAKVNKNSEVLKLLIVATYNR